MVEIRWCEVGYKKASKPNCPTPKSLLIGQFLSKYSAQKSFFYFHVLISHVKSNHHDEHRRYLCFNRQHHFCSLGKALPCPLLGY
jgi:hypothetical protein